MAQRRETDWTYYSVPLTASKYDRSGSGHTLPVNLLRRTLLHQQVITASSSEALPVSKTVRGLKHGTKFVQQTASASVPHKKTEPTDWKDGVGSTAIKADNLILTSY